MKAETRSVRSRFVRAAVVTAALFAMAAPGFAQDTDGDGMSNAYENFFFLNPTNPADALLDYDGDTLTNRYEAAKWTDPWTEDTDMDSWWDNWDSDPLSRAVFYWGAAELTTGNVYRYTGPKWCLWGSKVGAGVWSNGWFVAPNNAATNNCLRMDFNRAYLTNDLSMDLYLYDHAGAALYADLLSSNGVSISNNVLGNLVKGTNQTRIVRVTVPLKANPAARTLQLRRTAGEVRVYGTVLFVDRDGDRLDDAQEAYIGSSPTNNALPFMIPGRVEVENFNSGGEGVSYHDTTSNNEGGQYRTTEGVDIEACSDTNGGYNVGYTKAGEWMDYTVNVLTAGWYNVIFRVANGEAAGAQFHLDYYGSNITGLVTMPGTGGWQAWQDVVVTNVWLYRGAQILTLVMDSQGAGANAGNYNHIRFALARPYVNNPPRVTVSGDTAVVLPAAARLNATIVEDGEPDGALYGGWRQVLGPASAAFTNTLTFNTSASFPVAGTYVLRMLADDGEFAGWGDITVNVTSAQPPSVTSMYLDSMAAASTPSRTVTLTNWCSGSPTQYMASEASNFSGAAWQTYSTGPSFTLSSNAGTKTVYFKVKNALLESQPKSDSIVYSPPVPLTMNAAPVTNSISVLYEEDWYTFTAGATGAYTVVAQRGTLTAGCFVVIYEPGSYRRAIIGVQTQATFTASVTGTYYVSVSVLNGTATGSYSIRVIKGQPPWVTSMYMDSMAASTPSRTVTLTNWCGGDPTQYMASEASNFSGAAWQTYSTGPSFTLSSNAGVKTVYFKVRNDYWESPAKNWSIQYSPPITLAVNGAPITNSISVLYEEDWYTFNAGVTGAYAVIAPQGTLTAACYVVIYGPNSYRQSIIGTLTQAAFTATSVGTYYVRVSVLNGTATGSYTVRLAGPSQQAVTNSLVGRWSFEQTAWTGAVNEVVDSSGLGNHGRAYNGAAPVSGGVSGRAASFGTTNAYVEIPNSSSLQVAGNMTLSFWIKANNIGNNRLNPIDKNYGGEFALTIETDGRLSYYHGTAQSTSNYWSWTALPANKLVNALWQHVTIVRDAVSNRVSSYYNGALVSQTTYATATNLKPKATTSPVRIGRGYTAATLNGRIDEVQIHSRAFSAAEVSALYMTNRPANQRPYAYAGPDLVVKWPASASLNGKAADDGLPSNRLSTAWSKVSGTGTVTFANATSLVTTASFSTSGIYVLNLAASDTVLTSNDTVRVVVNQPPSIFAGTNRTLRLPASLGLTGTMWDDGVPSNKVTVVWDRVSGPGPVIFSVTNNLITLANFSSSGVHVLRLRASDTLMTSTSTVSITVSAATGTVAFQEGGGYYGLTAFEAEQFETNVSMGGSSWVFATSPTGFSGTGVMTSAPNAGVLRDTGYVTNCPRLDFRVNFRRTGTHYVWVRGRGPSGNDDSCHVGLDGAAVSTADKVTGFTTNWGWSRSTADGPSATLNITNLGLHTINVWMREDGFVIDRIALATNAAYTPTGLGPPASERSISWLDSDGDGLSNWEETSVYGTNPLNRDSDGDGLLDGYDPRPTVVNVSPVLQSVTMTSTGNFHTASAVAFSAAATDADGDALSYQFIVDSTVIRSWSSTATASWTPGTNSWGYHVAKVAARDPLNATNQIARSVYIYCAPPKP